ncbi:MAG: TIM barrel protein [Cyclobacteriaceae bacterium]
MNNSGRRDFIRQLTVLGLVASTPLMFPVAIEAKDTPFLISLNPAAIGVSCNQNELLDYAIKYGFNAMVPIPSDLQTLGEMKALTLLEKMQSANIRWDAFSLPVEFRKDDDTFRNGLKMLQNICPLLQRLGIKSCSTWIMPTHDSLTYRQNFDQHTNRLVAISRLLAPYEMQLGIEYVGPKTLRVLKKYPFISSLKEARELIAATRAENIGIQLDSFHWYCAGETKQDLLSLTPEEIITCDMNDAVKGRTADEQLDYERELPGKSGVINLKMFLSALQTIGYDGPVRAEPFNRQLNEKNDEEALSLTAKYMRQALKIMN